MFSSTRRESSASLTFARQGDTFEFRISGVGKVYVTGFTDDRSRFRVRSGAYLHKGAKEAIDALRRAVRKGRIPRETYLDNGKQFIAKEFKAELARHRIRPIFGRPYHPRGRGKIESYHKALWSELISQVRFSSLAHFKRQLKKFDRRYNYWRKSQALGWKTPAEVYNDPRYLNKEAARNHDTLQPTYLHANHDVDGMPERKVVVCIPAFNEEKTIAKVVIGASKFGNVVIVCDDGSTDMTEEIAAGVGAEVIRHQRNLGKGMALKDLFGRAKKIDAEIIVTLDGDDQHNPRQIPLLLKPILDGDADIVNGSRFLKDNPIPGHRRIGDKALNRFTNALSRQKVTDTQSGFRAYSRTALERIEVKEHGMGVDSHLLIDASEKGLRVVEVPIDVTYSDDSSTYHPAKHGTYVILSIIRVAAERSPLLYLGLPGLISALVGIAFSVNVIALYNAEHYFSLPQAIIALGAFVIGLILVLGAMMLYTINNLLLRLREG